MNEVRLLLRKDLLILKNNILLIFRNPARLIPYAVMIGYFVFMYTRRFSGSKVSTDELNMDAAGEVDFALQKLPDY